MSEWNPSAFFARLGDRRLSSLVSESDPLYVAHGCRWLRDGRITLATGREGKGKSTLARQISAAVSVGGHYLAADSWTAEPCTGPGQVVYVSGDEPPARIAREFERFDAEYGDYAPDGIHAYGVDDVPSPDALRAILTEIRPVLLVVDPLIMLIRPERDDYRTVYYAIRQWLPYTWTTKPQRTDERVEDGVCTAEDLAYMRETGEIDEDGYYMAAPVHRLPAVLGLHHQHRDREMRSDSVSRYLGSVAWGAAADAVIDMSPASRDDKTSTLRKIEIGKSRFSDVPAGTVEWLDWDDGDVHRVRRDSSYGYIAAKPPAAKLAPAGVESGLRIAVAAWRAENPTGTKTACARDLGISRGSMSARYQSLTRVWAACKSV